MVGRDARDRRAAGALHRGTDKPESAPRAAPEALRLHKKLDALEKRYAETEARARAARAGAPPLARERFPSLSMVNPPRR